MDTVALVILCVASPLVGVVGAIALLKFMEPWSAKEIKTTEPAKALSQKYIAGHKFTPRRKEGYPEAWQCSCSAQGYWKTQALRHKKAVAEIEALNS